MYEYKYLKYKEKYFNLYKNIHGGYPNHSSTKLIYISNPYDNPLAKFYVFQIGRTPYFQIFRPIDNIQMQLPTGALCYDVSTSYYVSLNYLQTYSNHITTHIINNFLSTDHRIITDIMPHNIQVITTIDGNINRGVRTIYTLGTHIAYNTDNNQDKFKIQTQNSDDYTGHYGQYIDRRGQHMSGYSGRTYYVEQDVIENINLRNLSSQIFLNSLSTNSSRPTDITHLNRSNEQLQRAAAAKPAAAAATMADVIAATLATAATADDVLATTGTAAKTTAPAAATVVTGAAAKTPAPTVAVAAAKTPAKTPAKIAAPAKIPAATVPEARKCPICEESTYSIKVYNNTHHSCIRCKRKVYVINVSYCNHFYCNDCAIEEHGFDNIDISQPCMNQNKDIVRCPICNVETKYIINSKFGIECSMCMKIETETMIPCCGHCICGKCYQRILETGRG